MRQNRGSARVFGVDGEFDGVFHPGGSGFPAFALDVFQLGKIGFVTAAEAGLLEGEIAEVFAIGEKDLGFHQNGTNFGVGLV